MLSELPIVLDPPLYSFASMPQDMFSNTSWQRSGCRPGVCAGLYDVVEHSGTG